MSFAKFILNKMENGTGAEAEVLARRKADGRGKEKPKRAPVKRGRPATKWNNDRDLLLAELAKEFDSQTVAMKMGVSYQALKTRAFRIGVKLKTSKGSTYHLWTTQDFEMVKRLYDQGLTSAQIGQRMNLTEIQVRGAIGRMGIAGRKKKWSQEDEVAVARYYRTKEHDILCAAIKMTPTATKSRYCRLVANRRLAHLRTIEGVRDLVAEYCEKNNVSLPSRNV